jgi:hypothetical protein
MSFSWLYISHIKDTGMIFFQLFNWFQLFFCEKEILKTAGNSQNKSKMTFLKWGLDGFSYFLWFSVILFYFLSRIVSEDISLVPSWPLYFLCFQADHKVSLKSDSEQLVHLGLWFIDVSLYIMEINKCLYNRNDL